jgi:hypothetical protein
MSAEMGNENFVMVFDIWLPARNLDCLRYVFAQALSVNQGPGADLGRELKTSYRKRNS